MADLRPLSLRPLWPDRLCLLPRCAVPGVVDSASRRPFAVWPLIDRDPRECAAHARDRRPGRAPPARHLHDLGRAGGGCRRADRADDAVCRAQHLEPRAFRRRADHADHRHVRPRRRARPLRPAPAMTPNGPALETRALSKSFGALRVADSIDFRLERGARHALIGPNGAGKTSFVNLVTGALRADTGAILIDGAEVTSLPQSARVKRGLARTFQVTALFRRLTALENVTLAIAEREGVAHDLVWPAGRHHRVIEEAFALLEALDLAEEALRPVNTLAYGRQRLIEIAVALGLAPKVLLLDEPAAGVPSSETGLVVEVVERLPTDIAVLIIDHDMDLVFRLARRITVMVEGRILVEGPPEEIAGDPQVRQVYLGERTHGSTRR